MGCYGIGIARILSAVVEQNNDEHGIVFPEIIAPYDYAIIILNTKDEKQMEIGNKLYNDYLSSGFDVLLDDRNVSSGVKFKDIELIGIPKIIVVGKNINDGYVECRNRITLKIKKINI